MNGTVVLIAGPFFRTSFTTTLPRAWLPAWNEPDQVPAFRLATTPDLPDRSTFRSSFFSFFFVI